MNVLFSITYYEPYVSGLTIWARRMAGELVKRGHHVAVVCFRHDLVLPPQEQLNGISVHRVSPWVSLSKGFISPGWLSQSIPFIKESDSVVVHLPQFEGWITAVIAKWYKKRIICVYHCEIELPKGVVNKCIQYAVHISNLLSIKLCDSVVTYTQDYANHSKLLKPFLSKVHPFYPPVKPPNILESEKEKLYTMIGNRDITIGVAARLAKEKGIEYLIQAIPSLRKLGKLKIVVAGPMEPVGEESYKRFIMELTQEYKEEIVFLGTLNDDQMGAFYSLLDVLVLPSVNSTEAFGMVQVEAMLCGTPVIASALPGVRVPITRTGMGELVPIGNSQSLASSIVRVIQKRKAYVKPFRAVENEFQLTKTVNAFEKLLS